MSEMNQQPKSVKPKMPKIRFEGFSGSLEQLKLGNVAEIVTGFTPSTTNDEYYGGQYLFVSPTDINNRRYITDTQKKLTYEGYIVGRSVRKGSILFVCIGSTIGKIAQAGCELVTNQQINSVVPNSGFCDSYVYVSLLKIASKLKLSATTQAVPIINKRNFSNELLFFPEQKEQTQIGNFFQELDKLIELQTRAVESAETYKKAMLQKMFPQKGEKVPRVRFEGFSEDWSEKIIGDIANIKRGASPRPISDPKWFDDSSSIGWVRISDVTRSFRVLEETEQYLSELGIKKSRLIKSGSIIMSICATIGKPVYTAFDVCIHDGFVVFDDLKIDKDYTLYFLQTIQEKWYQYGQPGTQVNLNSDIVSQEKIVFPSLEEQTSIGNFFQKLDQNIESEKKKLEQYQTMKRAMLQRMFV